MEHIYKLTFNTDRNQWDYLDVTYEPYTDDDADDETVKFVHLSSDEDAAALVNRWNRDLATGYREIHTCKDCGKIFFINAKEKDWYAKKKYQLPKRCKACRAERASQKKHSS